ncbi:MAG: M48 family metalloprotease [Boseongicola sp.]|nr:MAG: M48 family metalloprotease [Boseongicola sp.]
MSSDRVISTPIYVGATPEKPEGFADFFDGRSAKAQRVAFEIDDRTRALTIRPVDAPPEHWKIADLREVPDQADASRLILTTTDRALTRLILTDSESIVVLRQRAPKLSVRPPARGRGRVMAWAAGAVAAVFAIVFLLVPVMADQLAKVLPTRGEQALGEATLEQIRSALSNDFTGFVSVCSTPEGDQAIATMLATLEGDGLDLPYPIQITVLDHSLVNAFALPGGQVVFFRGILDMAEGPDEIAAVLAHEIGHVAARDPTRIALRSAGSLGVLGLLFGDFAGGAAVLFLVEQLIQADYSREAEAAADNYGIDLLLKAGIDPAALGTLFQRMQEEYGEAEGIAAHFTSHPALGDRIANSGTASDRLENDPLPSLSDEGWTAIQNMCG